MLKIHYENFMFSHNFLVRADVYNCLLVITHWCVYYKMAAVVFNDIFLLQFATFIFLFFFFTSVDIFIAIWNAMLTFLLISLYLWVFNLDILVNFLVIIDLGLFFTLIAFLLNITYLFVNSTLNLSKIRSSIYLFLILSVFLLINAVWCQFDNLFSIREKNYIFNLYTSDLIFYNWISIFNQPYFSDLQLLGDLYFNFNLLEFIFLNLFLYVALLTSYILFSTLNINLIRFNQLKTTHLTYNFLKTQDLQQQLLQSSSVRIWTR